MTNDERKRLLARMEKATTEAKSLPREAVLKRLVDKGFVNDKGHLAPEYGGSMVASR